MISWQQGLIIFSIGFFGIICGQWLGQRFLVGPATANAQVTPTLISAESFELTDRNGKKIGLISNSPAGTPGIWLFDRNGKVRLNIGLYEDDNATIVLNDSNEEAVQIFRTVGEKNAPVLVMKHNGQDRIVLGLNFATLDPFFVFYDSDGKKNTLFGNY